VRAAPDVILVGEIRDAETHGRPDRAGRNGAICASPPCTRNNCAETLDRIINMFPRDQHNQIFLDLSQYLRAILSQRLVPAKSGIRVAASEGDGQYAHISESSRRAT